MCRLLDEIRAHQQFELTDWAHRQVGVKVPDLSLGQRAVSAPIEDVLGVNVRLPRAGVHLRPRSWHDSIPCKPRSNEPAQSDTLPCCIEFDEYGLPAVDFTTAESR